MILLDYSTPSDNLLILFVSKPCCLGAAYAIQRHAKPPVGGGRWGRKRRDDPEKERFSSEDVRGGVQSRGNLVEVPTYQTPKGPEGRPATPSRGMRERMLAGTRKARARAGIGECSRGGSAAGRGEGPSRGSAFRVLRTLLQVHVLCAGCSRWRAETRRRGVWAR